jgi:hypothetical protein
LGKIPVVVEFELIGQPGLRMATLPHLNWLAGECSLSVESQPLPKKEIHPAMQSDEMKKDTIMEAYKFETNVSENGTIQLPEVSKFANRKIEVFIVVKQQIGQEETTNEQTPEQFTDKWRGFLKGSNPDDAKFRYLSEKFK